MNSLPTGWMRSLLTVAATDQPRDFALPLRMPSVGFAILFGSGVGPGQIG